MSCSLAFVKAGMAYTALPDVPLLRKFYKDMEDRIGAIQAQSCSAELVEWVRRFRQVDPNNPDESLKSFLKQAESEVLACFSRQQEAWQQMVVKCVEIPEVHDRLLSQCAGFPFADFAAEPDIGAHTRLDYRLQRSIFRIQSDEAAAAQCQGEIDKFWRCVLPQGISQTSSTVEARWKIFKKTRVLAEEVHRWSILSAKPGTTK